MDSLKADWSSWTGNESVLVADEDSSGCCEMLLGFLMTVEGCLISLIRKRRGVSISNWIWANNVPITMVKIHFQSLGLFMLVWRAIALFDFVVGTNSTPASPKIRTSASPLGHRRQLEEIETEWGRHREKQRNRGTVKVAALQTHIRDVATLNKYCPHLHPQESLSIPKTVEISSITFESLRISEGKLELILMSPAEEFQQSFFFLCWCFGMFWDALKCFGMLWGAFRLQTVNKIV